MSERDQAYAGLLQRLFQARRFGVVLGLERMQELLQRLGRPDTQLGAIVHVGGTNGKGSTAAMIAAMLAAAEVPVGLYTSPHLSSVRERISFAGRPIDRDDFCEAAEQVRAAGGDALTFFEQLTAIAMVALARRRPAVTVLEVGLGGRLDATNVVESEVAVVTGVALDHEAVLGDTLEQIAQEKAGIFRRGRPAVLGDSGEPAALPALRALARQAGVQPILEVDAARVSSVPPVALRGPHQRRNAAAAWAAVEALRARGAVHVDEAALARGLAQVVHPGRCEEVPGAPTIVLDGAHNPHGARALAAALEQWPAPRVLVLAVSSDKDASGLCEALVPAVSWVVATQYQQERSLPAQELAALVAARWPRWTPPVAASAANVADALALARPLAGPCGTVVVAGSLFLIGEARVHLLGAEQDPLALSDPPAR